MTTENKGGFAPSVPDIEFESLWTWWVETHALDATAAKWLSLYQYTGGNAFGLTGIDGDVRFAPRGEA